MLLPPDDPMSTSATSGWVAALAFTSFLEKTRKERGLTYGALAEMSKLHLSTVHEILRGRPIGSPTAVSFLSLCALANALELYFCLSESRTGKIVMRHPGVEPCSKT